MDENNDLMHGDEIVEEDVVVEEGEVYDNIVLEDGDGEMYLEADDIDVEDLNGMEGAYLQLETGEYVQAQFQNQQIPTMQLVQHHPLNNGGMRHHVVQDNRRVMQPTTSSAPVYAMRGNQMFRVDKPAGVPGPVPMKSNAYKYPQQQPPQQHVQMTEKQMYVPSQMESRYQPAHQPKYYAPSPSDAVAIGSGYSAYRSTPSFPPPAASAKPKRKPAVGTKKPCNCNKSMCLKLYCDCFANGEFCRDCNCKDCHNNMNFEAERSRAIKASLERNPNAFKPKIGITSKGRADIERLHQKGCHCKKSNCLKNYCECFEAKVPCTERCKCVCCRNSEGDRLNKYRDRLGPNALVALSNAASAVAAATERPSTPYSDEDSDDSPEPSDPKTLPWFYMTDEVVEATTLCMVAQAEEVESKMSGEEDLMEKAVLNEFARCLGQIIQNATTSAHATSVNP